MDETVKRLIAKQPKLPKVLDVDSYYAIVAYTYVCEHCTPLAGTVITPRR
jgi:hypothetical protein